jgi:predicted transcriptional regulator
VEGRKASLSQTQARELRERLGKGESVAALATEYGVSRQTVYNYNIA